MYHCMALHLIMFHMLSYWNIGLSVISYMKNSVYEE